VQSAWLTAQDLEQIRERLPIVYVDAIPVRVDDAGRVIKIGLLLRGRPDGSISRAVISGRVLYGERIRDALLRHIEKDLGGVALPQIPTNPAPFTVAEYFPDPEVSGFHDPRQHAVSLVYVVPVKGDCAPSQDALDLVWLTPAEAISQNVRAEMTGGQDLLVQLEVRLCQKAIECPHQLSKKDTILMCMANAYKEALCHVQLNITEAHEQVNLHHLALIH
jgi:ADP-ribose pyrophosphatase YjhB (NUDIX family)